MTLERDVASYVDSIIPNSFLLGNINRELQRQSEELTIRYNQAPAFNFIEGEFVTAGGNIQLAQNTDNLKQWITAVLSVAIDTFIVYDRIHGNPVNNLIYAMNPDTLVVIVPRIIKYVLERDDRITRAHTFSTRIEGDALFVDFMVDTFENDNLEINKHWNFG